MSGRALAYCHDDAMSIRRLACGSQGTLIPREAQKFEIGAGARAAGEHVRQIVGEF